METPENFETTSQRQIAELQEELYSVRTLLSVSLVLMIIFTLCVDRYLFKQVSGLNGQNTMLKTEIAAFNQPKMIEFWNMFMNYAKGHPEYVPVIAQFADPNVLGQTILSPNANAPKK